MTPPAGLNSTLTEVFATHVKPRLSEDAERQVTAMASPTGKEGTWKEVDMDEKVQLVADFGCRFLKFTLAVDVEPPAKRRCPEKSAFDIMLGAAAVKDRLPQERSGNSKDRLYNDVLKHLKVSTKKKSHDVSTLMMHFCLRALHYQFRVKTISLECEAKMSNG